MKKMISALLVLIMMLALVGCASGNSGDTGENNATEILYGWAIANYDESIQELYLAEKAYFDDLNASQDEYHFEFVYTDAAMSVDKQIADVESLVAMGADIILITPVDVIGSYAAAEIAHNAGVLVVDDSGMTGEAIDLRLAAASIETLKSDLCKAYVLQYLEENPDVVLKYGILLGGAAQVDQLHRKDFVYELAEEYPDRVQVLAEQYVDWQADKAQATTEDWIQVYGGEMNAFCTANTAIALGCTNALAAAGFNFDDVVVTSYGGTTVGRDLIRDGRLDMCVDSDRVAISIGIVQSGIDKYLGKLEGDTFELPIECYPAVTINNIDDFDF